MIDTIIQVSRGIVRFIARCFRRRLDIEIERVIELHTNELNRTQPAVVFNVTVNTTPIVTPSHTPEIERRPPMRRNAVSDLRVYLQS